MTDPVRVRFAPSPTGFLHVGGLRTVLFNWLFARKHNGQFILRLEDTDQKRYTPGGVRVIMEGLLWLGLNWDEGPDRESLRRMKTNEDFDGAPDIGGPYGPYVQSLKRERHQAVAEELIARGHAYRCDCTPERLDQMRKEQRARKEPPRYDRLCRFKKPGEVDPDKPHVIRFAVPLDGTTTVHDAIRGEITIENRTQDDFVILKSDGFPTYHLAHLVDDHDMHISHVMRAEEWLPSLPRHILIYNALEWQPPIFAHLPVILNPSGQGKMSKRKAVSSGKGADSVFVSEFREAGYLPEAMFNFLALVGWAPGEGNEQEIFTRDELIRAFSLEHVSPSPAGFDYDKLDKVNGLYIRALPVDDLTQRIYPFLLDAGLEVDVDVLRQITPYIQERLETLADAADLIDFLFVDSISIDPAQLIAKGMDATQTETALRRAREALAQIPNFDHDSILSALDAVCEQLGIKRGQLFTAIRVAISGKKIAPPLDGSLQALGRTHVLERIDQALQRLGEAVA